MSNDSNILKFPGVEFIPAAKALMRPPVTVSVNKLSFDKGEVTQANIESYDGLVKIQDMLSRAGLNYQTYVYDLLAHWDHPNFTSRATSWVITLNARHSCLPQIIIMGGYHADLPLRGIEIHWTMFSTRIIDQLLIDGWSDKLVITLTSPITGLPVSKARRLGAVDLARSAGGRAADLLPQRLIHAIEERCPATMDWRHCVHAFDTVGLCHSLLGVAPQFIDGRKSVFLRQQGLVEFGLFFNGILPLETKRKSDILGAIHDIIS